jgi:hypothetical protein
MGAKKPYGFFRLKFYVKKTLISCSVNEVLRSTLFSNLHPTPHGVDGTKVKGESTLW